jgi:hypothetical protein
MQIRNFGERALGQRSPTCLQFWQVVHDETQNINKVNPYCLNDGWASAAEDLQATGAPPEVV